MNWYLDFDDTLAIGGMTWALEHVFPTMIKEHNLPYDEELFNEMLLWGQRQANQNVSEKVILDEMFGRLGWPDELKLNLGHRVYTEYVPALFDDTLPFLDRVKEAGHTLIIISNNNYAPKLCDQLGISDYFAGIYTPERCEDAKLKPDRDMWDIVLKTHPVALEQAIFVGDDPWSDGDFAENIGITCWIVDRLKRYGTLHAAKSHKWANTLLDIEIPE